MSVKYFVTPECGREERYGARIGPFDEFLQLTYDWLRIGPDGDIIAEMVDGSWYFVGEWESQAPGDWSDIIITAEAS